MAEQENIQVNDAKNGEGQPEEARQQVEAQAREISAAYDRARQELNDAIARLRAEVDKIDMQQARQQAADWVKENPALATFLALGGGILVGRLLSSAFTPEPPPTLSARMRLRAADVASQARDYAGELGEAFATGAAVASGVIAHQAGKAGKSVRHFSEQATDRAGGVADRVSRRASEFGDVIIERASDFTEELTERGGDAAKSLEKSAHDLSRSFRKAQKRTKKKVSHGMDAAETALGAARTLVAAVLIKKVNDWIKRVS